MKRHLLNSYYSFESLFISLIISPNDSSKSFLSVAYAVRKYFERAARYALLLSKSFGVRSKENETFFFVAACKLAIFTII